MNTPKDDTQNKSHDEAVNKEAGQPPKPDGADQPGEVDTAKTFTQADIDAAEARGRKAVLDAAKQKEKDSKLSEDERLKQRAEQAESQLRARDARDQLESATREAGASNPSKLYRLIKDDLAFDDNGKPTNVKELVAQAKRDYPDEFGAKRPGGSADGGAGRGGGGAKTTMNDLIRRGR